MMTWTVDRNGAPLTPQTDYPTARRWLAAYFRCAKRSGLALQRSPWKLDRWSVVDRVPSRRRPEMWDLTIREGA